MIKRFLNNLTRHYFNFNRSDRNAIIILSFLILLTVTANHFVKNRQPGPTSDFSEIKRILADWEHSKSTKEEQKALFAFDPNTISETKMDSLDLPGFIKRNMIGYREAGGVFRSADDVRKIYGMNDSIFNNLKGYIEIVTAKKPSASPVKEVIEEKPEGVFDPNMADEATLMYFGFNRYHASNLVSYRNSGGRINKAEDLLKIYGVDSSFYNRVAEYIAIEPADDTPVVEPEETLLIELNSADSAQLVRLNGIGPYFSARIIRYRNLLGGFHSKEQLKEIYNFPEETYERVKEFVYVDTSAVKQIRINFAEYRELLRHPYLEKKHVEAILEYRGSAGAFKDVSEMQLIKGVDEECFEKIRPYITCR